MRITYRKETTFTFSKTFQLQERFLFIAIYDWNIKKQTLSKLTIQRRKFSIQEQTALCQMRDSSCYLRGTSRNRDGTLLDTTVYCAANQFLIAAFIQYWCSRIKNVNARYCINPSIFNEFNRKIAAYKNLTELSQSPTGTNVHKS